MPFPHSKRNFRNYQKEEDGRTFPEWESLKKNSQLGGITVSLALNGAAYCLVAKAIGNDFPSCLLSLSESLSRQISVQKEFH